MIKSNVTLKFKISELLEEFWTWKSGKHSWSSSKSFSRYFHYEFYSIITQFQNILRLNAYNYLNMQLTKKCIIRWKTNIFFGEKIHHLKLDVKTKKLVQYCRFVCLYNYNLKESYLSSILRWISKPYFEDLFS